MAKQTVQLCIFLEEIIDDLDPFELGFKAVDEFMGKTGKTLPY